jgi:ABC-type branched-subunit amino acid transport system substrate-binding protein
LTRGSEVFFKALNDAGGIGGYKIELEEGDSQYATQLAVQQYTKIAPDVAMFGQVIGAPSAAALKDQAESDKILILAATADSSITSDKYVFTTAIPYPLETINGIDYAVNQLGKKGAKFAIVYQDDAYGQDCLKGYKAAIQAYGLNDVGQIPFKVTDKDFTAQATQLKNSGAEVVWMASQPTQTAGIMGTATQLGVQPQWMLQSAAFNSALLATPLKPVLLKALVASYGVDWGLSSAPGEAIKLAAIAKYAPDQKPDNYFTAGWSYAIVTTNILAKALANGDVSRDGIFKAFESVKNIDLGNGPTQPTISYGSSPNERVPFRFTTIYKVDPADPAGYSPITPPFVSDTAKNYKF